VYDAQHRQRFASFSKAEMCMKNILLPYLAIYISYFAICPLFKVKQLKQDIKSRCNSHFL